MLQAVVSNPQPILGARAPAARLPRRGLVSVRSTRNGATDNLDHLRRPPTATPKQQGNANPPPRRTRRVIQTSPFGLWDSFPEARTLDQMMRTMERIMDEDNEEEAGGRRRLVVPAAVAPPAAQRAEDAYRRGRTPWEIKERAGDYLVRFDMPGMTREDVRVSVRDRTLVVVAEKAARQGEEAEGEDKNRDEEEEEAWPAASYGRYRTRVELPENVEVERIAAEVRDGVLYLTIPKLSPSGGKVVSIQVQ